MSTWVQLRSMRRGAVIAVVLGALLTGCGSTTESAIDNGGSSEMETCAEAETANGLGEKCAQIRWHEAHEGPTVYNNFHGYGE